VYYFSVPKNINQTDGGSYETSFNRRVVGRCGVFYLGNAFVDRADLAQW
jgi:hypothetical protein